MSPTQVPHPTILQCIQMHPSHEVHFKVDLSERLGGEEGISAVTDDMGSRLKVNAVESLGEAMSIFPSKAFQNCVKTDLAKSQQKSLGKIWGPLWSARANSSNLAVKEGTSASPSACVE